MKTLKKEIIVSTLSMVASSSEAESISLVFVTPLGMVIGKPVINPNPDIDSDDYLDVLTILNRKICQEVKKENSLAPDESLDGNDGVVLLKDVVIKTVQGNYNLNFLNLFFDQIIGISLSNR